MDIESRNQNLFLVRVKKEFGPGEVSGATGGIRRNIRVTKSLNQRQYEQGLQSNTPWAIGIT